MDGKLCYRQKETLLLQMCKRVADGCPGEHPENITEASILHLASILLQCDKPEMARNMRVRSEKWFTSHGEKPLDALQLINQGLISDLPRFQSMTLDELRGRSKAA